MMKKQLILIGTVMLGVAAASFAQESKKPARADYSTLTLDNLPHIQVLIQQAIDAGVSIEGSIQEERRKIRRSGYLPTFKVQGRMTQRYYSDYGNVDVNKTRSDNNTDSGTAYYDSGDHGTGWGAQGASEEEWAPEVLVYAQWDLDKVFFHTDELNMTRRHIFAAKGRSMVIKRVRGIYVVLEGLLEEKGSDELGVSDPLAIEIDIAATQLDYFTNQYVSQMLERQQEIEVSKAAQNAFSKAPAAVAPAVAEPAPEARKAEAPTPSAEKKTTEPADSAAMLDLLKDM